MTFADRAAALSGSIALLLGWRPAEFWDATPTELFAILQAGSRGDPGSGVAPGDIARLQAQFPDTVSDAKDDQ